MEAPLTIRQAIEVELASLERELVASVDRITTKATGDIRNELENASVRRRPLMRKLARIELAESMLIDQGEGQGQGSPPSPETSIASAHVGERSDEPVARASAGFVFLKALVDAGGTAPKTAVLRAVEAAWSDWAYKKSRTKLVQRGLVTNAGNAWRITDDGSREYRRLQELSSAT